MTEERRREILAFERDHENLSYEEFFIAASRQGITIEDLRAAEEEPEE